MEAGIRASLRNIHAKQSKTCCNCKLFGSAKLPMLRFVPILCGTQVATLYLLLATLAPLNQLAYAQSTWLCQEPKRWPAPEKGRTLELLACPPERKT
eukprot:5016640-Amphidinium_carterae.1